MDILSHGLWGGAAFGRKSKRLFWWAFFFGIAPDLFSFGVFTASTVLGLASGPDWSGGPPPESAIPAYVHQLYHVTHSLVIFAIVFAVVTLIRRKPFYPMLAWPLHILVDIPTHSARFFPTPFLWPLFDDVHVDGIPWSHPAIFIPNVVLLALVYLWFFYLKPRREKRGSIER
jgi:hypothetical protein